MNLLFQRFDTLRERYTALSGELADAGVRRNPAEFQRLAKEYAELSDLLRLFESYQAVLSGIRETESLVQDSTGETDFRKLAQEELMTLRRRQAELEEEAARRLAPRDPRDDRNTILEIRAGTGGEEAALFAADLLRLYAKFSERRGWKIEVLSSHATGMRGFREVILLVEGRSAYSRLKYESGVHRVQRVPMTESAGRIHTSTVTVAVLPEADEIEVRLDQKDLRIDTYCASGPGGQSVNTAYSAVRVTHLPTGHVVTCQDERSQLKNKQRALKILRARLLELEQSRQQRQLSEARRMQIGTGDRSEKIRTYNFPQNRVTDHRIGVSLHKLDRVMDGDLDEFHEALMTQEATARLEAITL